jgi:hypothetical protein
MTKLRNEKKGQNKGKRTNNKDHTQSQEDQITL